jgi:hypothetical protein
LRKSRGGAGGAPAIIHQAIPDLQGPGDVALPNPENVSTTGLVIGRDRGMKPVAVPPRYASPPSTTKHWRVMR